MKRFLIYTSLLGVFLTAESCRDSYLETVPTSDISAESITQTADNMMLSINGMHRSMYTSQGNQSQSGQSGIMIMTDALGDDLVFPSVGNGWYVSAVRWLSIQDENSADVAYPWRFYYKLIRNANVLINGGDNASGSETTRNNALGQAYAFRAFCHFQLVQLYAKRYDGTPNPNGIPLRLEPNDDPLARSSVEEVYKQINADLDKSIELLNGISRVHKSHFNVEVVRGIKARVALVLGNYKEAAEQAKLARQGFTLMSNSTYKAGFNSLDNSEWIWGSSIKEDQTAYFANFGAYMSRNFSSTNIRQNPKAMNKLLYSKFPSTDVRTQVVDPTGKHLSLSLPSNFAKYPYTSQKFLAVGTGDSRMDVPYMRAAEMYLIEAEALARLGKEPESKVVFTEFSKNRNPAYVATTATGEAYINEILDSRRIELWGEGFRFLDLKRLNQPLNRTGSNHNSVVVNNVFEVSAGDSRWTFLIPRRELNANPLIKQN
ncbi:RagB/SusD family nutrient uptake outer membrane protein [Riemerella anatipestifer]|nr:RagB/SusD family nutrient uptake outer membrane protein [Riemerella anatipestifer]MDY3528595.1 RagB/SusD family nutrient uptake outer membrane protein [Riemerella anatipestifer]